MKKNLNIRKHSDWNVADLHIHSKYSNKVKGNSDYTGEEYSGADLMNVMKQNGINIFSVTDHNCINTKLYDELMEQKEGEYKDKKINYIVGVELDIYDNSIHNEIFHALCLFDTKDHELVKKCIDEIFDGKKLSKRTRNDEEKPEIVYPDVKKIFSTFSKNGIKDFLMIPHFNNKHRAIPQDIAVDHLNYLCFNAYEDSNNVESIKKSLDTYLKAGFEDFPFLVFSDNHNLENYPASKQGKDVAKCSILGNNNFPFSSIKTSFQEPRLRISIEGVELMRKAKNPEVYISEINLNGKKIELSPYQNTIIGKFGSGKSLLMTKIRNGCENIKSDQKYKDLYDPHETFKLKVGENYVDSIEEALQTRSKYRKYEFVQQEEFYFKNQLTKKEADDLLRRINVDIEFKIPKAIELDEVFCSRFISLTNMYNLVGTANNFNYEHAFAEEDYFNISNDVAIIEKYEEKIKELTEIINKMLMLKEMSIYTIPLFTNNEITKIKEIEKILGEKERILNNLCISAFEADYKQSITDYRDTYINNNSKEVKEKIVLDFNLYCEEIIKLHDDTNVYEQKYTEEIHTELNKIINYPVADSFSIDMKINIGEEYVSVKDKLFITTNKKRNLFLSLLNVMYNKSNLKGNKQFSDIASIVKSYNKEIEKLIDISNSTYDLKIDNSSILKKSAGEKSSEFIKLIFSLIKKDLKNGYSIIILLDQPEDNIDNENTFEVIADSIRKTKLLYPNLQLILVTHNANVGISADSENIIIAKESVDEVSKKSFVYQGGAIENENHIVDVCQILEGGKKALEKRSVKYGINIIKKVEKNEI